MRIINTGDNPVRDMDRLKIKNKKSKLGQKKRAVRYSAGGSVVMFAAGLLCIVFFSGSLSGCRKNDLQQANINAFLAQQYYQTAVSNYKALINNGKDLYFSLGKLYYDHGDLNKAVEALSKSSDRRAHKLLAISEYKLNNLTDALKIFQKYDILDNEYIYYCGLTNEKLNLFDQSLDAYRRIKSGAFFTLARARMDIIEKQVSSGHINVVSPFVSKIISAAPPAENYPQAGALILFCDERVELGNDNTKTESMHYVVKILNERGKKDFAETPIEYDSTDQKVELEYARTIKPDGTVINVGSRHLRDVSKYMNFPLYSNARIYIISFPEISDGTVIEYKVRVVTNQLINKKDFITAYSLQSSEPVLSEKFSISLPKGRVLHVKTLNQDYNDFSGALLPKIEEEAGKVVYKWSFKDVPQIIPEPNMPPGVEVNTSMLMSTFSSWQEVYNWWWNLAKDKIKPDQAIKDKVKELARGCNSEEDKARAIYNFCAQKIRYVAVEYGQAGYQPHSAADIFRNKYGDCKDKAILLVTMLKEAGIVGYPVLIPTRETYNLNKDFPATIFNHCICQAIINNKPVFLDSTAETCSFGDLPASDQGRSVLVFKEGRAVIENTPVYQPEHNFVRQEINIKVNPDESISASKVIKTFGQYDQAERFWLLYTPPELINQALGEKIQELSIGSRLNKYDIKNLQDLNSGIILSYDFFGPEYFTNAGNLRIMPQLAGFDTSLVAKDNRRYPLDFGVLDSKETIFEVAIPHGFVIKYMPEDIAQDSPWMRLSIQYSRHNDKLSCVQRVNLKVKSITVKDYPDFKAFFQGLAKRIKQRIILEKTK